MAKKVKITLEISESFQQLLQAEIQLNVMPAIEEGAQLTPGKLLMWLVSNEVRGTRALDIASSIPIMNRPDCPDLMHEERRVYEDGRLIAGEELFTNSEVQQRIREVLGND